ncbi:MAG: N-acetylglucosamine-6-phosphate deacetylase [Oscillospiraceae bacterium]|nr:N-acetylglucosamine-6-phosphate deacetylase [Oscillospiraceae bacterium]
MLLKNANIIFENEIVKCNCQIVDGKIVEITQSDIDDNETIDCEGLFLSPGFIDLHVHGGGGYSFMDENPDNIKKAAHAHALHGTTGILPTMLSSPEETLIKCANRIASVSNDFANSDILGVHFEGPYLSPAMSGAQSDDSIFPVNVNSPLLSVQNLKMITMAPELQIAQILAKQFAEKGVTVAVGHTNATFEETESAFDNGFSDFTHIYNASSSLHKEGAFRIAGAVESALTNDKCTVQVIGDLRHLPLGLVRLIYKCKGADKAYFITDGLEFSAADLTEGEKVIQANGVPAVYTNGVMMTGDLTRLAGSASSMDTILRNAVKNVGISLTDAVKMVSSTPAKVIGVDNKKGYIKENYDADLVLFDEEFNIKKVMVKGKFIKK